MTSTSIHNRSSRYKTSFFSWQFCKLISFIEMRFCSSVSRYVLQSSFSYWRREFVHKWIYRISRRESRIVSKWVTLAFDIDVVRFCRFWVWNQTCESKRRLWRFEFLIEIEWRCWISRKSSLNESDEKLTFSKSWRFSDSYDRWKF